MSTYQEMSSQLDKLITELQDGSIDIDEALQKYEKADKLIEEMEKYLKNAENKIEKIKASVAE